MKLENYVEGRWIAGRGEGRALINPVTGDEVARADASGIDMQAAMNFARTRGVKALQGLSFKARGQLLKSIADTLSANRGKYGQIARINSGNTLLDAAIDIDGGIGTLKYVARLASSLDSSSGDARIILEPGQDQLAKEPVFFARHIWTSRPGIAVQVNAYNFPSWGMWEKVAMAMLAGVPSIAKPATATAWLAHEMVRDVIAAKILPDGALNLVCGGGEALIEALQPMDSLAFTGSAATGEMLRGHANILKSAPRVSIEADSINATIVGPDAAPGNVVFDLAVREIVNALSVKAGQLCTNIRRVFVARPHLAALQEAVMAKMAGLTVGDPLDERVRVGPLVDHGQQRTALEGIAKLAREAKIVAGGGAPQDAALGKGAFVSPTLLVCDAPREAKAVHETEVFGPCATLMAYDNVQEAVQLAARGGGSLALSVFSNDQMSCAEMVASAAPWHGRVLVVDEETGKAHTGHAIVMPQCVHGGPGRAGGGEELGGLRGLRFHMQRSAVQGSGKLFEAVKQKAAEAAL